MKILNIIFFAVAVVGLTACSFNDKRPDAFGGRAVIVEFNKNGVEYVGMAAINYIVTDGIETITDVSAVIICEKDGTLSPSISVSKGVTEIKMSENTYKINGKNLCLPSRNGNALEVLPFEPPEESRESVATFRAEIKRLLEYVEPKPNS